MINIRKLFVWFLLAMLFASCNSEDSYVSKSTPSIEGEWFMNMSDEDMKLYATSKFNADGTMTRWFAAVGTDINYIEFSEGTYSLNRDKLITHYEFNGEPQTYNMEIRYLDGYSLNGYDPTSSSYEEYVRIIDTYDMKVGETRLCCINDLDFESKTFQSSEQQVATVDESGRINAVKRGVSFITASSTTGRVVFRVNVTDPDNVIDDYINLIGSSLDDIKKTYGNGYRDAFYENGLGERTYNLLDDVVKDISFVYAFRKIQMIFVDIRENVNVDLITESFNKKYKILHSSGLAIQYIAEQNDSRYLITLDIANRNIAYMEYLLIPEPDPEEQNTGKYPNASYRQFDGIVGLPVIEVAQKLGHEITEEEWEEASFDVKVDDNEIFEKINVSFDEEDPYIVGTVILYCKSGVAQEDIEDWYKNNYRATGDEKNPYCSEGETFYIRFKKSGSRLTIYYSTKKTRK